MELKSTLDKAAVLGYLAAAALWIALLGPAWAYIPATPTMPAVNMNFADFVALDAALPTGGLQHAFYSWGAWLFAALATVLAILIDRLRTSVGMTSMGMVAIALGLIQLVVSVLALKGEAAMSVLLGNLPYLRVGSALFLIGIFLLTASGVARLVSARSSNSPVLGSPVPAR
ncbi:hypothetical protein ACFVJ5_35640 [Nocardia sp. NPDC127606]|uniref:hypothetical protein n=1 Tax=Nocardia sp. NPDC127606 TaxID=3345406 RepID=UPI0036264EA6